MSKRTPRPALAAGIALALLLTAAPALADRDGGPFLGITSRGITGDEARRWNLPSRDGVVLETVYDGTAAADAGLRAGDVLVEFDGEKIYDDRDLTRMIRHRRPGDRFSLGVVRDDERIRIDGIMGSREEFEKQHADDRDGWDRFWDNLHGMFRGAHASGPRLGVHVQELDGQLADYFEVERSRGVLLTRIGRHTPAEEAGLLAGDVVVRVDGRRITGSGDIGRALRGKWGEAVEVDVIRRGEARTLSVQLEEE